jgi:DnaK suppressor protein
MGNVAAKGHPEPPGKKTMSRTRYLELKKMLLERRYEIRNYIKNFLDEHKEKGKKGKVGKRVREKMEQDQIALLRMKNEELNKLNVALAALERRDYGYCHDCGTEISEKRLRALPFAVRCKGCEEKKEIAEDRERLQVVRRHPGKLFLEM